MELDLKDPEQFSLEGVRKLLGSKDDSEHRQLRGTKEGIAFLSDDVGADNLHGLAFRLETFCQGNDYVGERAAGDDLWVKRVFDTLKVNWPKPTASYIDSF